MIDINEIAKTINSNGGHLYLVGGAVRDELLGIKNHDEDYSVTGISFDEFKKLFPMAYVRGKDFPVFSIDNKEFAIARKERKIGIGHKDFDVKTDKKITIGQDLERRDITINAIAKEVLTGKIIDPFGGIEDLKNKIIRAVSSHFEEDPLRVYRVARFASQFDFKVEENTIKMMTLLKNELTSLSVERVYNEFSKALLTDKPSIFFDVLKEANVLDVHFKEIYDLIGAEQPPKYHPEGDSYNHTMIVLDKVAEKTNELDSLKEIENTEKIEVSRELDNSRKLEIRFSALVHDLGKGTTTKEEYPHHFNHEKRGAKLVKNMGKRLKLPTRLIKCGVTSCLEHMRGGIFDKMTASKKVKFIERVNSTILGLDGLQIIVDADDMTSEKNNSNQFAKLGYEVINCTNGNEIMKKFGITEGKEVANKMHEVRVEYLKKL
ncbi:MAG: HD domain-containing protein [Clostridia bacterium]|nr:HD domain-containing protein [Clostridia bacterium]